MAGMIDTDSTGQVRTSGPGGLRRRRRSLPATIVAVLAVLLVGGILTSCETTSGDRAAVINSINHSRAQSGLPALRENSDLNLKADLWASKMRDRCDIFHSKLSDGAPPGWRKLGENVGRGGTVGQVHVAYMNSPGHRRNILDRSFTEVGAGAVWGTCNGYRTVFTVQFFMRR